MEEDKHECKQCLHQRKITFQKPDAEMVYTEIREKKFCKVFGFEIKYLVVDCEEYKDKDDCAMKQAPFSSQCNNFPGVDGKVMITKKRTDEGM